MVFLWWCGFAIGRFWAGRLAVCDAGDRRSRVAYGLVSECWGRGLARSWRGRVWLGFVSSATELSASPATNRASQRAWRRRFPMSGTVLQRSSPCLLSLTAAQWQALPLPCGAADRGDGASRIPRPSLIICCGSRSTLRSSSPGIPPRGLHDPPQHSRRDPAEACYPIRAPKHHSPLQAMQRHRYTDRPTREPTDRSPAESSLPILAYHGPASHVLTGRLARTTATGARGGMVSCTRPSSA